MANIESKLTEVETQRMIDECVNKRIKEEIEKKDAQIDLEVCRRVEDAKKILERQMKEELQSKKEEMEREMQEQEVSVLVMFPMSEITSLNRARIWHWKRASFAFTGRYFCHYDSACY